MPGHTSTILILASESPRRAELLRGAGIPFEQRPSGVDENSLRAESPRAFATEAALAKARAVAAKSAAGNIVVGADTIVCVGSRRLGKPACREEAREMLGLLQGRRHEVLTGLAVGPAGGEFLTDCAIASVWFRKIPAGELEAYLDTPEPYDKAGAYAIQGWAGDYVERIEGDIQTVIGLPVTRLREMLDAVGWQGE